MADKIATREAYGAALAEFGAKYDKLVVLEVGGIVLESKQTLEAALKELEV